MGGLFRGTAWQDTTGKECRFMIVWGTLTEDPKITCINKTKTMINVKYHTKAYQNCVCWGDGDAARIMGALSRGDEVLCIGTQVVTQYRTRTGVLKTYHDLNCDFVIPNALLGNALDVMMTPKIQDMILRSYEEDREQDADEFEGEDDYEEEETELPGSIDDPDMPFR